MTTNWQALDEEGNALFFKQMEEAMKGGAAARDFYGAAVFAKRQVLSDNLAPATDEEGNQEYSLQQGLKAASHGREEICAVLTLQLPILQRLDQIKALLWTCVAALAYIGYRVSS